MRADISFLFFFLLPRPFFYSSFIPRKYEEDNFKLLIEWSVLFSKGDGRGYPRKFSEMFGFESNAPSPDQVFRGSRKGWMDGGDGSLSRSFREGSRYKVSGKDSGPRTQWFVNFWPMRCVLGRDEETFQIERVILIYLWTVQLAQTTGLSDFQFRNRDLRSRTVSRDRLQSPIFLLILLFLFPFFLLLSLPPF